MEGEKEINFIDAIRMLNGGNVRLLIIGRRAVILYGAPLMTADYDLWIDPADRERALSILEDAGIELSRPRDSQSPFITGFSGMRKFDLFFHRSISNTKGELIEFDSCHARSELIDDPDKQVSFRVPSIPDLIKMKQIRESNVKDEQDIEFLLKAEEMRKKL